MTVDLDSFSERVQNDLRAHFNNFINEYCHIRHLEVSGDLF